MNGFKMSKKGKLFVISGSSGVGKGTLIKKFLEKNQEIKLSISFTTRLPRPKEVDGINYFFTNKDDFESAIEKGEFLEWAKFSENYYGTKSAYVEKTLNNGENLLLEIETQGALQVMKKFPDAEFIFILPPSIEVLESRLRGRGTETEEAIQKRLSVVKQEFETSKLFTHRVINDNIEDALNELQKIFYGQENV
jgi:guanylate kinase